MVVGALFKYFYFLMGCLDTMSLAFDGGIAHLAFVMSTRYGAAILSVSRYRHLRRA
jgi:hypothetical protein